MIGAKKHEAMGTKAQPKPKGVPTHGAGAGGKGGKKTTYTGSGAGGKGGKKTTYSGAM